MTFWLVWSEKGGTPTVKHDTEQHARTEAERLARKHAGETFHVLGLVDSVTVTADVRWDTWQPAGEKIVTCAVCEFGLPSPSHGEGYCDCDVWGKTVLGIGYCYNGRMRPCRASTNAPRPAVRPPHPGKIADEERKARGWFHGELADRLRWNRDFTDMWLQGDIREMSEINFIDLNRVFGPSPDFWRKLYEAWRDWKPARRDCNTCRYLKSTPQDSACWACSDAEPLWHPKGVTP
jgi:plasmid maintenance system antidote protein VapI